MSDEKLLRAAAAAGDLPCLKWIVGEEQVEPESLEALCLEALPHPDVLRWLLARMQPARISLLARRLVDTARPTAVQCLPPSVRDEITDSVVLRGLLPTVKWLKRSGHLPTTSAVVEAALCGRTEAARLFPEKVDAALRDAARSGNQNLTEALLPAATESGRAAALAAALRAGRNRVVKRMRRGGRTGGLAWLTWAWPW